MSGRFGKNEWKIKLYVVGSIVLAIAAVSGITYGAYSYFWPIHEEASRKEREKREQLQAEKEKAAKKEKAEKEAQQEESENVPADAADKNDVEDGTASDEEAENEKKIQQAAAINEEFKIDSGAEEDYGAVLDPDLYEYYDSGISDFAFFYPAELYNQVTYTEEPVEKAYGMNLQSIGFTASGGSELTFTLCRRTDYISIKQLTDHIYEQEMASMRDSSKLVLSAEEDYGRVIVTGYTEEGDRLIYDMVKIEPTYVMQMKLFFPQYTGSEDQLQKGYVTECVYRMCAFSGSSKLPRSYQEYKKG